MLVVKGSEFVYDNGHFSSVLVLHRASKTIHVDDTIMFIDSYGKQPKMRGHSFIPLTKFTLIFCW